MKIGPGLLLAALSFVALAGIRPVQAQEAPAAEAAASPASTPANEPSTLEAVGGAGALRVGVNPDCRPFSFEDDSGERVGVDIELAKALSEALGVTLELSPRRRGSRSCCRCLRRASRNDARPVSTWRSHSTPRRSRSFGPRPAPSSDQITAVSTNGRPAGMRA